MCSFSGSSEHLTLFWYALRILQYLGFKPTQAYLVILKIILLVQNTLKFDHSRCISMLKLYVNQKQNVRFVIYWTPPVSLLTLMFRVIDTNGAWYTLLTFWIITLDEYFCTFLSHSNHRRIWSFWLSSTWLDPVTNFYYVIMWRSQ